MRLVIAILGVLFLFSCETQPGEKVPAKLISEEIMINLLTDIQLAEGKNRVQRKVGSLEENFLDSAYQYIYQYYQVDKNQVVQSYTYYVGKPKQFHEMMGKVIDKLERFEKK